MLNIGWWCSEPIAEAKVSLGSVTIGLRVLHYPHGLIYPSICCPNPLPPPLPPSSPIPVIYINPCSHRLLVTSACGHHDASRDISKICLVDIYWANIFFLLEIYVSISSNPASLIASSNKGYCQPPLVHFRGYLLVIHHFTQWWNPPPGSSQCGGSPPTYLIQKSGLPALRPFNYELRRS